MNVSNFLDHQLAYIIHLSIPPSFSLSNFDSVTAILRSDFRQLCFLSAWQQNVPKCSKTFYNAYASKRSIDALCGTFVGLSWGHSWPTIPAGKYIACASGISCTFFLHILCHSLQNISHLVFFLKLYPFGIDGSPPMTLPYSSLFHSSTTSGVVSWRQFLRPCVLQKLRRICRILHNPVVISLSPGYGNTCVNMDKFFEEKNVMTARHSSTESFMHMSLGLQNAAQKLIWLSNGNVWSCLRISENTLGWWMPEMVTFKVNAVSMLTSLPWSRKVSTWHVSGKITIGFPTLSLSFGILSKPFNPEATVSSIKVLLLLHFRPEETKSQLWPNTTLLEWIWSLGGEPAQYLAWSSPSMFSIKPNLRKYATPTFFLSSQRPPIQPNSTPSPKIFPEAKTCAQQLLSFHPANVNVQPFYTLGSWKFSYILPWHLTTSKFCRLTRRSLTAPVGWTLPLNSWIKSSGLAQRQPPPPICLYKITLGNIQYRAQPDPFGTPYFNPDRNTAAIFVTIVSSHDKKKQVVPRSGLETCHQVW